MDMEYPDEEEIVVMEAPLNEEQVLEGFAPLDVEAKIDAIIGIGQNSDGMIDDIPEVDVETKIRQMLDF